MVATHPTKPNPTSQSSSRYQNYAELTQKSAFQLASGMFQYASETACAPESCECPKDAPPGNPLTCSWNFRAHTACGCPWCLAWVWGEKRRTRSSIQALHKNGQANPKTRTLGLSTATLLRASILCDTSQRLTKRGLRHQPHLESLTRRTTKRAQRTVELSDSCWPCLFTSNSCSLALRRSLHCRFRWPASCRSR